MTNPQMTSKNSRLDHAALVVASLDRSTAFYSSLLGLEVAAGNDALASHSQIRKSAKLMLQFIPGADFIESLEVVCGPGGRWRGTAKKGDFALGDRCEVCGAQLTRDELETILEAGGPVMMDGVSLRCDAASSKALFKNSSSRACLPASRSSASIRASYSPSSSAATASSSNPPASALRDHRRISARPTS